jgi:transcriptional regulator with PAS, ATPase and Fis domain
VDARAGKFELANGGTLFLDEIGDMALETQSRILRVLQEGEVYRIGATAPRKAGVRIIAATNKDVQRLIRDGLFREDLYYRIATWMATLPPLRHRKPDIPNLAACFLAREAARAGVRVQGISRAALEKLVSYSWPGNIRQLEKEMGRAVLFLVDGELLDTSRLSPFLHEEARRAGKTSLATILEEFERDEILRALESAGGDVAAAAESLGLGRSTLYRRMKALRIEAPEA